MKKFLSGLITGLLISVSVTAFAAVQLKVIPNPFPVFINGSESKVDAYNINGSTYLKLSDLKTAGLNVKFADSKINVTSASTETEPTEPSLPDYTVPDNNYGKDPNVDYSDIEAIKNMNPTFLEDGDSFEKITYNKYSAIKYNSNTYVNVGDLVKKLKMKFKLSGVKNSFSLFDKDGNLILKTADANKINYIYCDGTPYLNISLISKYLEN